MRADRAGLGEVTRRQRRGSSPPRGQTSRGGMVLAQVRADTCLLWASDRSGVLRTKSGS